jgi:nucleoside-diphosphate-sugar epimerase
MDLTAPGRRRDPVFVEDVTRAIVLSLVRDVPPGTAINVGSGQAVSNEEIVATIGELAGRPVRATAATFPDRPSDPGPRVADTTMAGRLLGWAPAHSLRQGLGKSVAWFAENLDHYTARMVRSTPV